MFHAKVRAAAYLPILKRWFGYKGRTVYLTEGETAHISDYWSGGSRAIPQMFVISNDGTRIVPTDMLDKFEQQEQGNPYHQNIGTLRLAPGFGLAEHVFSGTRQYLRVTLHPSDDKSRWI